MRMKIIHPPSLKTGNALVTDEQALIEFGERQVVESGL